MTTTIMASYSYGEDCYQEIPEVLKPYHIKRVVLIGEREPWPAVRMRFAVFWCRQVSK